MSGKLIWDAPGEHLYETGVDQGVLYEIENGKYVSGVAWNGLTAVNEKPSGADASPLYANNKQYLNLIAAEKYEATIEAYTCPDEFYKHDGYGELATGVRIGQQARTPFGLCYRSLIGNDEAGDSYGYTLHMIYGAQASPSEKNHSTVNESPEAVTLSWDLSTTPINVTGHRATASLSIDSIAVDKGKLARLEAILYGVDAVAFDPSKTYKAGDAVTQNTKTYVAKTDIVAGEFSADSWYEINETGPRMPLPDEIATIFA